MVERRRARAGLHRGLAGEPRHLAADARAAPGSAPVVNANHMFYAVSTVSRADRSLRDNHTLKKRAAKRSEELNSVNVTEWCSFDLLFGLQTIAD